MRLRETLGSIPFRYVYGNSCPPKLALDIASCFVDELIKLGWAPNRSPLQVDRLLENAAVLKAVTNHQPKVSRFGHAVPEHASCVMI